MDSFIIDAEARTAGTKGDLRRLKRDGFIPGIIYGAGDSIPVSLETRALREILNKHGEDILLDLRFGEKSVRARIKEVQRDPVNQEFKHIDLMPVDNDTPEKGILH